MARLRVLLAEDHAGVRESLVRRLEVSFEIVGAVGDGVALMELARKLDPDIIVSDISMPEMSGLEAARKLLVELPGTRLLFLTVHSDPAYVREAFRAGAAGYVLKSSSTGELEEAIREVFEGRTYVSKKLRDED